MLKTSRSNTSMVATHRWVGRHEPSPPRHLAIMQVLEQKLSVNDIERTPLAFAQRGSKSVTTAELNPVGVCGCIGKAAGFRQLTLVRPDAHAQSGRLLPQPVAGALNGR